MSIAILILEQLVYFFIMILMGYGIVKSGVIKSEDSKVLSYIVLYVIMPCVYLNAFQSGIGENSLEELFLSFVAAILIHICLWILIYVFGNMFHLNEIERASVMYSNAGNLIIPIVLAILSEEYVIYASAYVTVQTFMLWSHGKNLICGVKNGKFTDIFKNINILAIALGFFLFVFNINLPKPLTTVMGYFSNMLAPVSMLVTGMIVAGIKIREIFKNTRVYCIALLRLLVCPLIILPTFKLFKIGYSLDRCNTILFITFLAATTPSASSIVQMAQIYNKDSDYANLINVVTTVFCIITMPIMVYIFECVY